MSDPNLTPAQRWALMALPPDGSWATAPRGKAAACRSFAVFHPSLGMWRYGIGPRGGEQIHYCLTDEGIALRRKLIEQESAP